MKKRILTIVFILAISILGIVGCTDLSQQQVIAPEINLSNIPDYKGNPYVVMNKNVPFFDPAKYTAEPLEEYSNLDSLGRCGVAYATVCIDIMPTEPRENISSVTPTGWQTVQYECVQGGFLYNRCHLIGYQLSGENANKKNLITGTKYLNNNGMLPFENMVADYVKETNNHVLYRVTPIFKAGELLARGVLMEAYSVEDKGAGIKFCVYCYNVQPNITIDYATGNSSYKGQNNQDSQETNAPNSTSTKDKYIGSITTKKFHKETCKYAETIKDENKDIRGTRGEYINAGYKPCKVCNP